MAVQKRICRHRRIIVIVQMQRVVITGQSARLMHVIVVTASLRMHIDFGAAISSNVSKECRAAQTPDGALDPERTSSGQRVPSRSQS